ncbi:acyl-CoA synthetase [Conexibacter sp. DBS9H8]|uniref:acyl-CoA synthetase n=1 Tax=Conexibacter sp. DBS9H8 TaxID=2937801 RepID=UPI00200BC5E9|nr:AMP-binding protein [Conexibacter sp. DBS9H8]
MNFAADVVDRFPSDRPALIERARDGSRREWSFGEVRSASLALTDRLRRAGVQRGDVVMTLVGNRPEWVIAMVACFRAGWVALPCNEQLRPGDLAARLAAARPRAIVVDARNLDTLTAARPDAGTEIVVIPDPGLSGTGVGDAGSQAGITEVAPVALAATDPCLITFTSGTTGSAKGVIHGQRYLTGQALQAEHWLAPEPGDVVWCTAASGWSKSARNVFIAPWLRGAVALLHDERFDPAQRLELLAAERVNVLCMAPTEYRVMAKRIDLRALPALRGMVAAGEALNGEVLRAWREAVGLDIRDGYGQTETGQLTANPAGVPAREGSMGRALPGVALAIRDGELVLEDPRSDPTFFVGYLGGEPAPEAEPWRTGDRVRIEADGYLFFEGRSDDVIISAGYRIGPFEVESALVAHAAVAEAAAVAAADEERGAVVRAVVVLADGYAPSDALARELQEWVKSETAPYKYPRIVDFVPDLPKTASGKVQRAALRKN